MTPHDVIAFTARYFGTTPEAVHSSTRERPHVTARHVTAYIMRKRYGWTVSDIGRLLNRHHASIIAAVRGVENDLECGQPEICAVITEANTLESPYEDEIDELCRRIAKRALA